MSSPDSVNHENDAVSVEAKFKVDPNLGETVASDLLGTGHPGVREIQVVGTTRTNCMLIVMADIRNPQESAALHEKIIVLIQSAREKIRQETAMFSAFRDSLFPGKRKQEAA